MIVINLVYGYLKDTDFSNLIKISGGKESILVNENNGTGLKTVNENWKIAIPKIGLEASIDEGVSIDILSKSIGHYENSGLVSANICLKAFSSGNNVNFFENIKSLRIGDEIIYKKDDYIKTYIVEFSGVINYDDLSYLAQGEENMITLITNIENEAGYLRCVQGQIRENL